MSVSSTPRRAGPYTGDGATKIFPFAFKVFSGGDIDVVSTVAGADTTLTTGYTVALNADQNNAPGGTVTFATAPIATQQITILSDLDAQQPMALTNAGGFFPTVLNDSADRAVILIQQLEEKLGRALLGPASDTNPIVMPAAAARANMYLAFDATGAPIVSSGTGADAGLRGDLANSLSSSLGAKLIGYKRNDASAVARTLRDKADDYVDLRDWPVDPTGVADSTAAIQAAINYCASTGAVLHVPAGIFKTTAQLNVPTGVVLIGPGAVYEAGQLRALAVFNIAHSGKGFYVSGATNGTFFDGFGTKRNQPDPVTLGASWAPGAFDWDFYVDGSTDVHFEDLMLVNPTNGIICTNGGGRFTFGRIWGQPLGIGIEVDVSLDVTRMSHCHFWDFWSQNVNVWNYTAANSTAFYSKRNDNPVLIDLFCIFYRYGLRIGQWTGGNAGTTSRMQLHSLECDGGGSAIYIDAASNGLTGEIHAMYGQGYDNVVGNSSLIDFQGTNGELVIYGARLGAAHASAINVVGAGSALTIYEPRINGFNRNNSSAAAVNAAAGIFAITLRGQVSVQGGLFGAANYAGTGRLNGKLKRAFTPSLAASTPGGTPPTFTVNSAVFDVMDNECEVIVDFSITAAGTGSGSILMGLPITTVGGVFDVGFGEETATLGVTLRVHVPNGSNTVTITDYKNAYPGGTGSRIVVRVKYRVA